jgi:hypothetical protein
MIRGSGNILMNVRNTKQRQAIFEAKEPAPDQIALNLGVALFPLFNHHLRLSETTR